LFNLINERSSTVDLVLAPVIPKEREGEVILFTT
jgi:hypothetical protein